MSATKEERQALRKKFIKELGKMTKEAYSGVTCMEYDAIRLLRYFIEMVYEREAETNAE